MPLYVITGGTGILLLFALDRVGLSSPWLNAKGMAAGSAALVAAGVAGAAAIFETGRRTEAAVIGAAIAAGVLWSNGLAYSNAWLAPRGALAELQTIGARYAGQGPTLTTDTEPYGTRHFLRRMDPEAPSERRRRLVPLLNGQGIDTGVYADLDEFQLGGILEYRTLVLPRSPVASRPSSPIGSSGEAATTTSGSVPIPIRRSPSIFRSGTRPRRQRWRAAATSCASRSARARAAASPRLLERPSSRSLSRRRSTPTVGEPTRTDSSTRTGPATSSPRSGSAGPAATSYGSADRSGTACASTSTVCPVADLRYRLNDGGDWTRRSGLPTSRRAPTRCGCMWAERVSGREAADTRSASALWCLPRRQPQTCRSRSSTPPTRHLSAGSGWTGWRRSAGLARLAASTRAIRNAPCRSVEPAEKIGDPRGRTGSSQLVDELSTRSPWSSSSSRRPRTRRSGDA